MDNKSPYRLDQVENMLVKKILWKPARKKNRNTREIEREREREIKIENKRKRKVKENTLIFQTSLHEPSLK